MSVRCAHCGEELLGAVNRCWKCGQQFAARPTVDGQPPVRVEAPAALVAAGSAGPSEPLEARVLDEAEYRALAETTVLTAAPQLPSATGSAEPMPAPPPSIFPPPPHPLAPPAAMPAFPPMYRPVPQRPNIAAIGGAYAALVLGVFSLAVAPFAWEAAIAAFIGLVIGIWGIYSPRRHWALVGMLLCALAMGLAAYTGTRELWLYLHRNAPISAEPPAEEDAMTP
jgi:hypothetical protein